MRPARQVLKRALLADADRQGESGTVLLAPLELAAHVGLFQDLHGQASDLGHIAGPEGRGQCEQGITLWSVDGRHAHGFDSMARAEEGLHFFAGVASVCIAIDQERHQVVALSQGLGV